MYRIKVDYIPGVVLKQGVRFRVNITVLECDENWEKNKNILPLITSNFNIDSKGLADNRSTPYREDLIWLKNFIKEQYIEVVKEIIGDKRREELEKAPSDSEIFEF